MRRLDEFRLFYNHTIFPELRRMEYLRKRMLLLLVISAVAMLTFIVILLYFQAGFLAFFFVLPFGFYMSFLIYRIQQFRATFKPNVVNLILDFIDNSVNYGTLKYDAKKQIDKKTFLDSKIFKVNTPFTFKGEDFISGKIGELDFELSELNVREYSKVRSRLNYVFRGIFLHATFKEELEGDIFILPIKFKQYLSKSFKAINLRGGVKVEELEQEYEENILTEEFKAHFMSYATPNADILKRLSKEMQHTIVNYRKEVNAHSEEGKELYVSFIGNKIYIAITEPKDILEPFIFSSNVSFELVHDFFEDIYLLMSLVEDFDNTI